MYNLDNAIFDSQKDKMEILKLEVKNVHFIPIIHLSQKASSFKL